MCVICACARAVSDAATMARIAKIHAHNYGVHGIRKVHAELRRQGHSVSRPRSTG